MVTALQDRVPLRFPHRPSLLDQKLRLLRQLYPGADVPPLLEQTGRPGLGLELGWAGLCYCLPFTS